MFSNNTNFLKQVVYRKLLVRKLLKNWAVDMFSIEWICRKAKWLFFFNKNKFLNLLYFTRYIEKSREVCLVWTRENSWELVNNCCNLCWEYLVETPDELSTKTRKFSRSLLSKCTITYVLSTSGYSSARWKSSVSFEISWFSKS